MSKDLLSEATRALRETSEVSELEARATRARVMGGLHQTRVRRRTRYAFLLPIAATFVAASAWGAASGKARLVWASIERMAHISAPAESPAARGTANGAGQSPVAVAALPEPMPTSETPNSAVPAPANNPSANLPRSAASSGAPRKADPHSALPLTPEEAADPTLALYRVAHTAHFVDHDPSRALSAWDAYLAAAPNGAFAPEAHYNRALSLVRLGRNSEARSALEPFANGSYGGYRQAEASALLERLSP
jgi:TolA-binding protein